MSTIRTTVPEKFRGGTARAAFRFALPVAATLALGFGSAGCATTRVLEPAAEFEEATATVNGVTIVATGEPWQGDPDDLTDHITPVAVELVNNSPYEVRVSLFDFALTDETGFRYAALNPYVTAEQVGDNSPPAGHAFDDALAMAVALAEPIELDEPELAPISTDQGILVAGRGGGGGGGGGFHGGGGGGFHGGGFGGFRGGGGGARGFSPAPAYRAPSYGGGIRPGFGGGVRPGYGAGMHPGYGGAVRPGYGGAVRPGYGGFRPAYRPGAGGYHPAYRPGIGYRPFGHVPYRGWGFRGYGFRGGRWVGYRPFPYYRPWFGVGLSYWDSPFLYPPGYATWVWAWSPTYYPASPTPPADVLASGISEGVLPPGGRVNGFLYFQHAHEEAHNFALTWDVHEARQGTSLGQAAVQLTDAER